MEKISLRLKPSRLFSIWWNLKPMFSRPWGKPVQTYGRHRRKMWKILGDFDCAGKWDLWLHELQHKPIALVALLYHAEISGIFGAAQHRSFFFQTESYRRRFFDHEVLVHTVQGLGHRVTFSFFGRVIHDAIAAAGFERCENSPVHHRAHVRRDFVVIEMNQDKVERTIMRQRELVEWPVDDADVGHARLLHAIVEFLPWCGIGRIDYSVRADQLRQDRRVVAAAREDIRDLIARFNPVERHDFVGLAYRIDRFLVVWPIGAREDILIINRGCCRTDQ